MGMVRKGFSHVLISRPHSIHAVLKLIKLKYREIPCSYSVCILPHAPFSYFYRELQIAYAEINFVLRFFGYNSSTKMTFRYTLTALSWKKMN